MVDDNSSEKKPKEYKVLWYDGWSWREREGERRYRRKEKKKIEAVAERAKRKQ